MDDPEGILKSSGPNEAKAAKANIADRNKKNLEFLVRVKNFEFYQAR